MSALVLRAAATAGVLMVAAGLAYAVLNMPLSPGIVQGQVADRLSDSGVENPVTAVLLNFRGYDTLLEMAVLTLAVMGIWSLREMPSRRVGVAGPVLGFLVRVLVPFMVLLGAYLLWAGSHAPGGAFQAGAVLAGGIVLVLLAGAPLPRDLAGWPLRVLLVLGVGVFTAVGAAMMASDGAFLAYPPGRAKAFIVLIEAAAALSIGVILASALRGGRPPAGPDR